MNGLIILATMNQWNWHTHDLYTYSGYASFPYTFTDSLDHPVILFRERWNLNKSKGNQWICFWWKDMTWSVDTLPWIGTQGGRWPGPWCFMGNEDSLWIVELNLDPFPLPKYSFYHGLGDTWDTLPSLLDTLAPGEDSPQDVFLDSLGLPVVVAVDTQDFSVGLGIYRFRGGVWQREWVPDGPYFGGYVEAQEDSSGHIHIIRVGASSNANSTYVVYLTNETGSWTWELVDSVSVNDGDFFWSFAQMFIDRFNQLHVFYDPYMYSIGTYQVRYAFRDTLKQWSVVDTSIAWTGVMSNHVVDENGMIHFACVAPPAVYHWHKIAGQPGPWTKELITNTGGDDASALCMAVDKQDYLHLGHCSFFIKHIYYATTNPNVGVSEPPVEPKPSLFLSVSPNPTKGLLKLQYGIPLEDEGLVSLKIYDVSGRAIKTVFSEEKSAGYYALSIPTSSFSSGTYFLRLEARNKAKTEKIILR